MTAPEPLPNVSTGSRRQLAAPSRRRSSPTGPTRPRSTTRSTELRAMPPLVFAGEARSLQAVARAGRRGQRLPAARGRLRGVVRRVLGRQHPRQAQGHPPDVGRADVQHRRADGEGRPHRRPVRQAPLVHPTEKRDGIELPSFRGDMVNDFAFDAAARRPDPQRMVRGYHQAAATLNLLRAFTKGGFADLQQRAPVEPRVRRAAAAKAGATTCSPRRSTARCGSWPRAASTSTPRSQLHEVDFYTSHEALLLGYEEALTRRDSLTGDWYDCSAHLLWVGERTRQLDGAHVEFLSGVQNPIGVKIGPDATPDEVVELCRRLDPGREPGPAHARQPHGRRAASRECLPPLLRAVHARRPSRSCGRATRCTATRSCTRAVTRPGTSTT